ncbi:ABC transporter C family member 14 [Neltuma alba]|uniref:ABC transporter C family member 14 n=1 Tax=Neltuma alba TaxID=207710 RepID=UPI0010A4004B|nr:ABC transporter C family member 14-like [Prosopis alba]
MPSPSWLTSLTCSSSSMEFSSSSQLLHWFSFILLSPCPQRVLFSSVDLFFLLILLVFSLRKFCYRPTSSADTSSSIARPLLFEKDLNHKVTSFFHFPLFLIILLAIAYVVLSVLTFTHTSQTSWKLIEALFRGSQAITNVVVVLVMVKEKKVKDTKHPLSLRIYWAANFVISCLFVASAIYRLANIGAANLEFNLKIDDILSIVSLPLAVYLSIVAVKGSSGIHVVKRPDFDSRSAEPLCQRLLTEENLSPYAYASLFSKMVWLWMNPLLQKGYKSPLKLDDVPSLPPEFRAEKMSELFATNWPKPEESCKHPVGITLVRCFWKQVVFTGGLAVIRLAVSFVGPVLIQKFVDYTSLKGSPASHGLGLVLILLLAKSVEVLSTHQFNFHSQKLGMLIRSSLITSLYKKGLRLSSSARQAHGAGQIVNYMAVDAQQLTDMMSQLHCIWLTPLQIAAALVLIYCYLGLSTFAAMLGTIAMFAYVLLGSKRNNTFSYSIMVNRDSRMKAMTNMLNNVRVIKFQAWEEHFGSKIRNFRELEYHWIGKFMYAFATNIGVLWVSPTMIAVLTFGAAILLGFHLDAGTVFTVMSVIKILQEPVRMFPQALVSISQAIVSLGRLDEYIKSGELDESSVERVEDNNSNVAVEIKEGSFSWDDEGEKVALEVSELEIKNGALAAVVGTVGSGKSSLLASVLGEMHKISGQVRVGGKTAYVAQTAWIRNATIEENILFELPMDREKYRETIRVCCLEKDLEMLEHGDQTEIGERGINLSGGQKQRVQLARAVYQDCDIYLLDDIFSAVDAQTGTFIFKECVMGALKDKAIILVTHQVDFLHNVDLIAVMRDGKIVQRGKYKELLESGLDFGALVAAHEASMELVERTDTSGCASGPPSKQGESSEKINSQEEDKSDSDKGTSKLIEDEEKETGRVNFQVYKQYCTEAYGWWGVAVVLLMTLIWTAAMMAGDYWLAFETSKDRSFNPTLFIGVYAGIGVISCIMVIIRSYVVTHWGLKTAQSFFTGMLQSILHAPMSFFDTTPSGRILSRMSADQLFIDIVIPMFIGMVMMTYLSLLSIFFVTCQNAWEIVFLILPLIWLNNWYRKYYLASSRELTRLDSIAKAPVIHQFSETISGVMTIRGFRKQGAFCEENINRVNANLRMEFHNNGSYEWLAFRLDLLGVVFLCIATMLMIFLPSAIMKPEYVGLSLSYGLTLSGVMAISVTLTCQVENKMVSVERIKQFSNITPESPWRIPDGLPPHNWPTHGCIKLQDLQVRYRPNTPLILKGITLSIQGGEKIGIVGRTGSGKSTLVQVLFRLVEPSYGKIVIDGINICTLGLHDLRSRFGIIPQEPVLFEGTVRSNIDPNELYSDEEIWKSLERCQLKDVVAAKTEKLDASVVDGGDNWSVGQRQLLCLGRVMLKRSQILFMDEATASVDSQTDAVIQKIIREDFKKCTILSVAHRIPTVMDCDRVLVIDAGYAKEFDRPERLLERPSLFGALVQEYSNRSC